MTEYSRTVLSIKIGNRFSKMLILRIYVLYNLLYKTVFYLFSQKFISNQ